MIGLEKQLRANEKMWEKGLRLDHYCNVMKESHLDRARGQSSSAIYGPSSRCRHRVHLQIDTNSLRSVVAARSIHQKMQRLGYRETLRENRPDFDDHQRSSHLHFGHYLFAASTMRYRMVLLVGGRQGPSTETI